jgi:hypothetical protein
MADESVHNNPQYLAEERFARLEDQVVDISHNMSLLIMALANKFGLFREVGGLNLEIGSDEKWGDNEDPEKESQKEPKKEQSSSSTINPSQSLFKMEAKVDIKPYQCEIDALKLNHWLQQLEVYFGVHYIDEEQKISFVRLKSEGHALSWWESHTKTFRLEGDPLVARWEDFKILIKSQFYPIRYVKDQWIWWHYFRRKKWKGGSVQEYTIEFKKMAIMLGISPKNRDVLLKYLGGLHSHPRKQVMLFKPRIVDEACA